MLANQIKKYIEQNRLLEPSDRVIVGVSGGPDSMALLHILHKLADSLQIEVIAAHLNHGLRKEAEKEEAFVKDICHSWGVTCYSCRVPVADLARARKMSLEEAGRSARYEYFYNLLEKSGAERIATAHHRDDVAETVLLHFLRGSGIKGLRGILPSSGKLVRPLLNTDKSELLSYLEIEKIDYCLDESNFDPAYMRNRIRHYLLPYLEKEFNPRIVGKLSQLALIARDENDVLEEETRRLWPQALLKEEAGTIILDNKTLFLLHPAYRRRIVLQAFTLLSGESEWSLADVEKVLELGNKTGSSISLQLKKTVWVNKSYDRIIFTTKAPEIVHYQYQVTIPGRLYIPETCESYAFSLVKREDFKPEPGDTYLDYDKLPGIIHLRSRHIGDFISPLGMRGTKKLKKYLIDLKQPYFERDKIALLAAGHEIYAVLGLGISRIAAVGSDTTNILLIKNILTGENMARDTSTFIKQPD